MDSSTLTVGNVNCWPYDSTHQPNAWWYVQQPYTIYTPPSEPTTCIGKAHVFECSHEPKCKCGEVTRVMPKGGKARA